jgi:segregation and condensation protein A
MSDEFSVHLERVFQGPLDLLLHLVREQEVEIHEVEISRVIDGFLAHVEALRQLDLDLAGEFLVMAATLMAIKSRSLLPREEIDLGEELDPKDELIQRLIEYRRFKEASDDLGERHAERARLFGRGAHDEVREARPEPTLDLGELTPWDLLAIWSRLVRETLANRPHHIRGDARPLRWYVDRLARLIRSTGSLTLAEVVSSDDAPTRESLVGSFCALLELVRLGVVGVVQEGRGDELRILLRSESAADVEALLAATSFEDEEPARDPAETPAGGAASDPDDPVGAGSIAAEALESLPTAADRTEH